MYEKYLVRKDSLKNVVKDGKVTGFKFGVRIANYRGVYLSLVHGFYVAVDGAVYGRELQSFEINGQPPRSMDEIAKCVWEHWEFTDEGTIHIEKPGGLEPGTHEVAYQECILAKYGYGPNDEAWVKNPPEPGKGGAEKTRTICTYACELKEKGA